jgi:YebC/PmpR family DNA-binding regulatory protein
MSGHNKWSQIKHKKAKEDAKKGKAFTKLIKEITVAARSGGGDPALNPQLRNLLDEARAINMPLDNANRAIKRGTGELPGSQYEAITYEGYGPFGTAIMIETLSDNRNRTVAELRFIFSSHNGNLGETGSVGWMFERLGIVQIALDHMTEDKLFEILINSDIKDIRHDDSAFYVMCDPKFIDAIKKTVIAAQCTVERSTIEWVAKKIAEFSDEQTDKVVELLSALQDHEDVQNVYSTLG